MAFRIEYYANKQRVMAVSCPKSLEEAIRDAAGGLRQFNAERAWVRDIDGRGRNDTLVQREP